MQLLDERNNWENVHPIKSDAYDLEMVQWLLGKIYII